MPANAAGHGTSRRDTRGVDEATYHYLEQLWSAALQRAQASASCAMLSVDGDAQPQTSGGLPASHGLGPSAVSATSFDGAASPTLRAPYAAHDVATSPLPRAPDVRASTYLPPAAALRRPASAAGHRPQGRMRVDAQPNLKRNARTAHRGVAWVVQ